MFLARIKSEWSALHRIPTSPLLTQKKAEIWKLRDMGPGSAAWRWWLSMMRPSIGMWPSAIGRDPMSLSQKLNLLTSIKRQLWPDTQGRRERHGNQCRLSLDSGTEAVSLYNGGSTHTLIEAEAFITKTYFCGAHGEKINAEALG